MSLARMRIALHLGIEIFVCGIYIEMGKSKINERL